MWPSGRYGGLGRKCPLENRCVNTWFPAGSAVVGAGEPLGGRAWQGEVSHQGMGFATSSLAICVPATPTTMRSSPSPW